MKFTNTIKILTFLFIANAMLACKDSGSSSNSATAGSGDASTYTSEMTKPDKKKYFDGGTVVYEIKYKPDGFKLRTASSDLIWKVKLYDSKIKISDNEENLNPYEIKMTDKYAAKLVKDEATLARTKYDAETNQQSISSESDATPEFHSGEYSPSLLVNRIDEIKPAHRQILIMELKAKGY